MVEFEEFGNVDGNGWDYYQSDEKGGSRFDKKRLTNGKIPFGGHCHNHKYTTAGYHVFQRMPDVRKDDFVPRKKSIATSWYCSTYWICFPLETIQYNCLGICFIGCSLVDTIIPLFLVLGNPKITFVVWMHTSRVGLKIKVSYFAKYDLYFWLTMDTIFLPFYCQLLLRVRH